VLLKVQDGCDYKCTIVPYRLLEEFLEVMRSKCAAECQNIGSKISKKLFLRSNIGDYGKGEFGNKNMNILLRTGSGIRQSRRIERFMNFSIEPNLLKMKR
jgi:hypothetical protein